MAQPISAQRFHAYAGVAGWHVLYGGAHALFRTGSFARGVALVDAIGQLADAAQHHPDVDLRPADVVVRTRTRESDSLTERDAELAAQISRAAADLGIQADPSRLQAVALTLDVDSAARVMPFWQAVLGYAHIGDTTVGDPLRRGPHLWLQEPDPGPAHPPSSGRRFHVDVTVPADQAQARVGAALAAGGSLLSQDGSQCWTLADPDGNVCDVAVWPDISPYAG
jgi:4a-hydroxytetrahydrobiopterin dehydratase